VLGRIGFLGVVGLGLFVYMSSAGAKASARVTITCEAPASATATADFSWRGPKSGAGESWLDLSVAPGFPAGWTQAHGPFAAADTKATVEGLPAGIRFYYRVNTRYGETWRATASGSLQTTCPAQGAPAAAAG